MIGRPLRIAAVAMSALLICAYPTIGGIITGSNFGTPTGALPYDLTNGKPTIAEFTRTLPAGLPKLASDRVSRVDYTLPEGRNIRKNAQGSSPDSDDKTNIRLAQDGDVWVALLTEGAG